MAYPAGLTTIIVAGVIGAPVPITGGHVTFRVPWMQGPAADVVLAEHTVRVQLATDGTYSAVVPATNDPAWSPIGFTIGVTIEVFTTAGWAVYRGTIQLAYDGPSTVDLADVFNPYGAAEVGETYALVGHTHPGGGGGGSTAWADITGKPATFPPSAHAHAQSDVTGLTTSLAGKAATSHTHVVSDVTGLQTALDGRATDAELAALDVRVTDLEEDSGGGGGGSTLVVRRGTLTTGNLTLGPAGAWAPVAGGPSMVLPAAVGDYVEFSLVSALANLNVNFADLAVIVGGTIVRCLSSGTASPASEGAPPFYGDNAFDRFGPTLEFVVQAGDLAGGNVTVQFVTKGSGGGTIYASTDYPLRWRAMNHGPADVA